MDSAFAWLKEIAEWLGRFVPKWVTLDTTEGAIRYRTYMFPYWLRNALCVSIPFTPSFFRPQAFDGDIKVTVCGPGLHWHWPVTSTWVAYPTARQTDRLETQTMESVDGKTFIAAGTLTYYIEDLLKLIPVVHLATKNTIDLAMSAMHDVCCDMTWADLQDTQRRGTLKTKLKNEAQKQLGEYGVRVIKFQLSTLARCRVVKVSQSTSNEEN